MSPHANAFSASHIEALSQVASVIAGLLSPSTAGEELVRIVMALPTAAVAVVGERLVPNAPTCSLIGYSGEEVATLEAWFNALYRDDGPMVRELYEVDRASGFLDARTAPITRKDGWERLVQIHCTSVGGGELWQLTDITERVASQERFRLLFEQSSTPHLLMDATGIVDCNSAAVALLGYRSKADLLTLAPFELSAAAQPDGEASLTKSRKMEDIARDLGSHRFDWTYRRVTGEPVHVEVTLTALTLGARRVLLAEWHDISERTRYLEALEHARETAVKHARAKADFLATMSHEIRTPMNGVIGMTRLLQDTPLDEQQREYVETVRACGEGLDRKAHV
jgi:PAS domain S-box-containing protein